MTKGPYFSQSINFHSVGWLGLRRWKKKNLWHMFHTLIIVKDRHVNYCYCHYAINTIVNTIFSCEAYPSKGTFQLLCNPTV